MPTWDHYLAIDESLPTLFERHGSWPTGSASIMIPQAAALNALVAHANRDVALARRQSRARALWWALVTTYCHTVSDPRHDGRPLDEVFPALTEV